MSGCCGKLSQSPKFRGLRLFPIGPPVPPRARYIIASNLLLPCNSPRNVRLRYRAVLSSFPRARLQSILAPEMVRAACLPSPCGYIFVDSLASSVRARSFPRGDVERQVHGHRGGERL